MVIDTVKIIGNGWLVNGNDHVPNSEGNKDCKKVMKWIEEGNAPEPEHTDQELIDIADEASYQEWKAALEAQKELDLRAQYELEKGL